MKTAVIGVGKVGLPLACRLVDLGHQVAVYDKNKELLAELRGGKHPLSWEQGIHTNFYQVAGNLAEAAAAAEIVFIVTPTPAMGGCLSSGPVVEVLAGLEQMLARDVVVVVVSTLDPRDAAEVCAPRPHMDVIYSPPLIRLGNVKHDLNNADIVFVGGGTPAGILALLACHRPPAGARIVQGDVKSIALAKLAINATLSMRAAWANEVSGMVVSLSANPRIVFQALGAEPRIGGTAYMLPGPPPGGPCLPRDLETWNSLGNTLLAAAADRAHTLVRNATARRAAAWAAANSGGRAAIVVAGLGYKKGGPDITDAVGPEIVKLLRAGGYTVLGYDPVAGAQRTLDLQFVPLEEVTARADAVILCHDYEEVATICRVGNIPMLDLSFKAAP